MTVKNNNTGFLMAYLALIFLFGCVFLYFGFNFNNAKAIVMGFLLILIPILCFILILMIIHSEHKNITKNTNKTSTSV